MSDTPRTDKKAFWASEVIGFAVSTDFARKLERENAALRKMLDLAFRIPNMTDAELAELIRNCRAAIDAARKEI